MKEKTISYKEKFIFQLNENIDTFAAKIEFICRLAFCSKNKNFISKEKVK